MKKRDWFQSTGVSSLTHGYVHLQSESFNKKWVTFSTFQRIFLYDYKSSNIMLVWSIIVKPTTHLETWSLSKTTNTACAQFSAGLGVISACVLKIDSFLHLSLVFLRLRNAFALQLCSTWAVSTTALMTQWKHEKKEYATTNNRLLRILKPISKTILYCFNHGNSYAWPFILASFNFDTNMQICANSIAKQIIHCIWGSTPANFKIWPQFCQKLPAMNWETVGKVS